MKPNKRGRAHRPSAPPIFDDGVDPLKSGSSYSNPSADRKTLQLCARVAEVLNLSLSGDGQDDLLIGWVVDRVVPVQGASLLMALVTPIDPRDSTAPTAVLSHLALAKPRLRSEIARAIQRRKTPDLVFQVVRPGDEVSE
jgi:ribosome-binding factor A